jgi:hypothetical protein
MPAPPVWGGACVTFHPMTPPPACRSLGPQCRGLKVTLRVAVISDTLASTDHEATWLLGHTQSIGFGTPSRYGNHVQVDATLAVPCRHYRESGSGAGCGAHGFTGPAVPAPVLLAQPRRLGGDRFRVVENAALVDRVFPDPHPQRALPMLETEAADANPCAGAPCRTADNRRGSACCRDLQIEIDCRRDEVELERLIRHRKSPYLCKVERERDETICAEMISACGFLDEATAGCSLHGRQRADGRTAKPDLCFDWPPKGKGLHPGCVFK